MKEYSVIKPFIGAQLHYTASESEKYPKSPYGMASKYQQPLHAVVIDIHSDRCVNLMVTDIMGRQFYVPSATLLQPGDRPVKDVGGFVAGRFASWPALMPHEQIFAEDTAPSSTDPQ